MALKRKRSETTLASSPLSTSSTNSNDLLPSLYSTSKGMPAFPHSKPAWWSLNDASLQPTNTSGRTRKRHRDDRPEEERIQASTIARLYDAQRRGKELEAPPSQHQAPSTTAVVAQKNTLHAFWTIRTQPTTSPTIVDAAEAQGRCQDCEGWLRRGDAMEVDGQEESMACRHCGRSVCDMCAVVRGCRVCLGCINIQ